MAPSSVTDSVESGTSKIGRLDPNSYAFTEFALPSFYLPAFSWQAMVELVVPLATRQITLGEIMKMKVGDITVAIDGTKILANANVNIRWVAVTSSGLLPSITYTMRSCSETFMTTLPAFTSR